MQKEQQWTCERCNDEAHDSYVIQRRFTSVSEYLCRDCATDYSGNGRVTGRHFINDE